MTQSRLVNESLVALYIGLLPCDHGTGQIICKYVGLCKTIVRLKIKLIGDSLGLTLASNSKPHDATTAFYLPVSER